MSGNILEGPTWRAVTEPRIESSIKTPAGEQGASLKLRESAPGWASFCFLVDGVVGAACDACAVGAEALKYEAAKVKQKKPGKKNLETMSSNTVGI